MVMNIHLNLDDTSEGFAFGGPLIKDKAFFYVTYEEAQINKPITHGPIGSGLPNEQGITVAEVDRIKTLQKINMDLIHLGYTSSNQSEQEFTQLGLILILQIIIA